MEIQTGQTNEALAEPSLDPTTLPLTLVLNPNARQLKLQSLTEEDFRALLPPDSDIHLTRDLGELDDLMGNWKNGERTLCFFGGDGSIARGITAFIRHHGEETPLPPVLPVRAGTINMLCNLTGRRETAQTTLERWLGNHAHVACEIPTLKVQIEDQLPHYGFVFAWGIGYRVLSEYYKRTETPNVVDAAAVATQAFLSAVNPFSESLPLFKRENLKLRINGQAHDGNTRGFHTLTVGTISRLTLGIRPFPQGEIRPGGFHFSANGMPLYKVAAYTPTLLFGLTDQKLLDFGDQLVNGRQVERLDCELGEGFTMDGEIFNLERPSRVTISSGPTVRFWSRQKSSGFLR